MPDAETKRWIDSFEREAAFIVGFYALAFVGREDCRMEGNRRDDRSFDWLARAGIDNRSFDNCPFGWLNDKHSDQARLKNHFGISAQEPR
jgi:hypothetical protein